MKPLSIALGAVFVASLAGTTVANAAENPFGMKDLSSGYMVAKEGKCGGSKSEASMDTKEGASKTKHKEGKCGEGKCGANRKAHEGKCGAAAKDMKEGKCGGAAASKETPKAMKEGKCGGSK